MEMVLGFLFSPDGKDVALIIKNKPAWQEGLVNGVGGKIEAGEDFRPAMAREFKEETGVQIDEDDWSKFAVLEGPDFFVACYMAKSSLVYTIRKMESEQPIVVRASTLERYPTVSNLPWLIPMALDPDFQKSYAVIQYEKPKWRTE